jgi:hypothetical protein
MPYIPFEEFRRLFYDPSIPQRKVKNPYTGDDFFIDSQLNFERIKQARKIGRAYTEEDAKEHMRKSRYSDWDGDTGYDPLYHYMQKQASLNGQALFPWMYFNSDSSFLEYELDNGITEDFLTTGENVDLFFEEKMGQFVYQFNDDHVPFQNMKRMLQSFLKYRTPITVQTLSEYTDKYMPGGFLNQIVMNDDIKLMKLMLNLGADPNSLNQKTQLPIINSSISNEMRDLLLRH